MSACPTCGKSLGPDVRFCPDDGTPLTETALGQTAATLAPGAGPAPIVPLPAIVGGRYRLIATRGGGGMAQVFRAVDLTLEREVAVKLINPNLRVEPEFDVRFQREARIVSQLADPHIVVVHDFGLDPALGPFLVMEYLQGQSLRERLSAEGPLPYGAALQLGAQLLLALIHAHEKGVIHRDIKPENIFVLSQSGVRLHVRVLDFGIARIYRPDAEGGANVPALTLPGAVMGTPRYMAPEQLAGQPADQRTDLYSAALVLFEALTNHLPHISGKRLCELCPTASPELESMLEVCLRPNPNDRPTSAAEVYLRLHELGKASGSLLVSKETVKQLTARFRAVVSSTATTQTCVPADSARRRRRLLAIAGVALLLALTATSLVLWPWPTNDPQAGSSGTETLLGLTIGDSRDEVISRLGKPASDRTSDPWASAPALLGDLIRPTDLDADRTGLELLRWDDDHAGVVLFQNAVRAVVVRTPHAAETSRRLRLSDAEHRLRQLYPEEPTIDMTHAKPDAGDKRRSVWGMVYRHAGLGLSFEVRDERVTAVALYPTKGP